MGYKPDWQNGSMAKAGASKPTQTNSIRSVELFHNAPSRNVQAKRFADGGEADTSEFFKDTVTQPDSGTAEIKAPAAEAPKSFGSAFKEARASGAKDFEYNGKKYTTELAGEKKSAQAKYDVGTEEDRTFARPAKTFAEDVAERKASMMKTSEPAAAAAPAKNTSVESNPRRRYATGGSAPAADTRTKEEKIKAAKGGKFVQGRTPE